MTRTTRQHIIAMGGGGFSMEPDNPLLDDYVLGLTAKARPRVCFVPTASGDAAGYIDKFRSAFGPARAEASVLTLFRTGDEKIADPRAHLLDQDIIYVGGGSTANLLAVWRVHGIDKAMREAWERGVILAGISAGMNCWFESSVTDSFGGVPAPLHDGLGLLPDSACPHYDGEPERRPAYRRLVADGTLPAGYAADDGAALHFMGTELMQVVTSRPGAHAYRVRCGEGGIVEEPLPVRYLGCSDAAGPARARAEQ